MFIKIKTSDDKDVWINKYEVIALEWDPEDQCTMIIMHNDLVYSIKNGLDETVHQLGFNGKE